MFKKIRPYIVIAAIAFIAGVCLAECRGSARFNKFEDTLLSAAETQTRLRGSLLQADVRVGSLEKQLRAEFEREKRRMEAERERLLGQIAGAGNITAGLEGSQGVLRELGATTFKGLEIIEKIEKRNAMEQP